MEEASDEKQHIGVRVSTDIVERIQKRFIDTKEYRDMSDFLRSLIDERLDPGKMDEIEEERLLKLLEKPHIQERVRKLLQPVH
jgi:Arc/MetJ-type ribon-helix-helix transcriptional regulator